MVKQSWNVFYQCVTHTEQNASLSDHIEPFKVESGRCMGDDQVGPLPPVRSLQGPWKECAGKKKSPSEHFYTLLNKHGRTSRELDPCVRFAPLSFNPQYLFTISARLYTHCVSLSTARISVLQLIGYCSLPTEDFVNFHSRKHVIKAEMRSWRFG